MGLPRPGLPMSSKLSTPNSNKYSLICRKFNSDKKCNPNICRYQRQCTFDTTRYSGSYPAAICPLNPNNQYLQDRIANYNPNYAPMGGNQNTNMGNYVPR